MQRGKDLMDKIIAYCGLVCSDCPAYVATQANDLAALEKIAKQWREEYNASGITVESVTCDSCLESEGRHCSHCFECEIRACGMTRGVVNCAYCADYGCDKLEKFFGIAPPARATLDEVRRSL